jgi:hypothetical protein
VATELDAIYRRILALLREDGRMAASKIARHTGLDVAPSRIQDGAAELVHMDQVTSVADALGDETSDAIPGQTWARALIIPWTRKDSCNWRIPADAAKEGAPMR